MKKEKEILRKQLELLAEQSKSATEDELPRISVAMCDIYKALNHPFATLVFIALLAVFAKLTIGFFVHIKKLLRSET